MFTRFHKDIGLHQNSGQLKEILTPEYKKFVLSRQCLRRELKPEDVARVVLFISSNQSSGCTNQNFIVDGGTR